MISKIKNMIEYRGLEDEGKLNINTSCFRKFILRKNIAISNVKPEIRNLLGIDIKTEVYDAKVITNDRATALEGQILTEKEGIIRWTLNLRIKYVEDSIEEKVHSGAYIDLCKSHLCMLFSCMCNWQIWK